MVRRTKAEALATREQILDAAEMVFHRQGVSRSTLSDIASEAGVTRGAIYWHFKNKQDVLNAMIERITLPLETLAEASTDTNEPDPLGRHRDVLISLLTNLAHDERQRRAFEIMFQKCELTEENQDILNRHRDAVHRASERTRRTFDNAVRKGQLPASLDTQVAATLLHCQIHGLIDSWLLTPERINLEEYASTFVDFFLSGITSCQHPFMHQS